uniref:DNA helicase n=1 Tax=Macrostomum lignano TaxID=282301 RepID=A0A1I8F137_9PLAT
MDVDVESLDFMESDVAEEVVVGNAAESSAFASAQLRESSGGQLKREPTTTRVEESPGGEARQPTVIQVHPSAAASQPRVIRIQTTAGSAGHSVAMAAPTVSSAGAGGVGDGSGKPVRVIRLPVQKLAAGSQQSGTGSIKIITLPPRSQQQQQQQIVRQVGPGGMQQQGGQTLRVITAAGAQRIIQVGLNSLLAE